MDKQPLISGLVTRRVTATAWESVNGFRVTLINGPRQSGKTTLLRELYQKTGGSFYSLDSDTLLEAAKADPIAFVSGDAKFIYIDEVQRGGDTLVRAIKQVVDQSDNRIHFVLSGSANFLMIPGIAESLAGRVAIIEVWPFSQGEITGTSDRFLTQLLEDATNLVQPKYPTLDRESYFERIILGGYPEPLRFSSSKLRQTWFDSYIRTMTQRDIRELTHLRQSTDLTRLIRYLAGETAHELVKSKLSQALGIDRHSVSSYLPLFEMTYLTRELSAWSRNPLGKVTRTPKIYLCDTGIAAHLAGVDVRSLAGAISPLRGQLVETFVHNEILKQSSWIGGGIEMFHWRDREGAEIDLIIETPDGNIFAVETKSSSTVAAGDFKWLRKLEQKLGDQFKAGIVFYLGEHAVSFGDKFSALPLSALWF